MEDPGARRGLRPDTNTRGGGGGVRALAFAAIADAGDIVSLELATGASWYAAMPRWRRARFGAEKQCA